MCFWEEVVSVKCLNGSESLKHVTIASRHIRCFYFGRHIRIRFAFLHVSLVHLCALNSSGGKAALRTRRSCTRAPKWDATCGAFCIASRRALFKYCESVKRATWHFSWCSFKWFNNPILRYSPDFCLYSQLWTHVFWIVTLLRITLRPCLTMSTVLSKGAEKWEHPQSLCWWRATRSQHQILRFSQKCGCLSQRMSSWMHWGVLWKLFTASF